MLGVGLGRNIHWNALPIWTHMGPYGYPLRARDVGLGPHIGDFWGLHTVKFAKHSYLI